MDDTAGPVGQRGHGTAVIPLFPLGTVLVPGLVLPLHVFEPRYRELLHDVLAHEPDQRRFGVVALRLGTEVGPTAGQQLYDVGTTALVREVEWRPDGRAHVVTTGDRRFRICALVPPEPDGTPPYQRAEVEWLDEPVGLGADVLAPLVARAFGDYRALLGGPPDPADLPEDPVQLSYAVAAAAPLDLRDVQGLLALPDARARLQAELRHLRRETHLVRELPSLPTFELPRTADPN